MLHYLQGYMNDILSMFISELTKGTNTQNCLFSMDEFWKKLLDRGKKM